MSAHSRGNLSVEASFAHLLTAIVRQNGGEYRIKGEVADMAGEPSALIREWDSKTQEVVLRCGIGSFVEIYRVVPERQPGNQVAVPAQPAAPPQVADPLAKIFRDTRETAPLSEEPVPNKVGSTLDDEKMVAIEQRLRRLRVSRMLREEIEANKRNHERMQTP